MKAYKLEILVIDFDECGESIAGYIENANYPNDCVTPQILSIKEADIGEWSDDHPLNSNKTRDAAVKKYFKESINNYENLHINES